MSSIPLDKGPRCIRELEDLGGVAGVWDGDTRGAVVAVLDLDALVDELLHRLPCLLEGDSGGADIVLAVICPAWRVTDLGVDVLEGDGWTRE